jgi:F-type H+-transporting ATPase subunit b
MLEDPRLWVAVSFVIFVALAYKKLATFTCRSLDDRSARIRHELDEARRLREEAEAVLAQYKQKQAEILKEAEDMLANARKDADAMRAYAEKELGAQLDNRTKQAMDRIAQEEAQAVSDVRNHVVDIALAAARALVIDQVSKLPQDELVKLAVSDIERKLH